MSESTTVKDCRGLLQECGPEALRAAVMDAEPVDKPTPETGLQQEAESPPWGKEQEQLGFHSHNNAEEPRVPANVFPVPGGEISLTVASKIIFPVIGKRRGLYMRNGVPHEIVIGHEGGDFLRPLSPERFCNIIENFGYKVKRREYNDKTGKWKWRQIIFPTSSARTILQNDVAAEHLPSIHQLANCPILTNFGIVISRGYHALAGGTYISCGAEPPTVPLDVSKNALLGLLRDFNFVSESDLSRAVASLISPALKMGGHIDDDFPLDVAEADQSQSGKTYRQKMIARIYAETPSAITASRGGVGSTDESIATSLVTGRPFITLDNFRGRLDSPLLEAAIRGHGLVCCRVPFHKAVEVDTRPFIWQLSTNGAELTRDIANRSIITRIRKQPDGYQFQIYESGDLLAHVSANQSFYLGAVFSIIREWMRNGCPRTAESRHDFRGWCRVMDWIVQNIFDLPPLLDGHREEQNRMGNPNLQWLREVCHAAKASGMLCREFTASGLVSIAEDAGVDFPGNSTSREEPSTRVGKVLARLFRESEGKPITVDGFTVTRRELENDGKLQKNYAITI